MYLSARTKEKKTLNLIFIILIYFLAGKKLQISSPSSSLLRDNCRNVKQIFVLVFLFFALVLLEKKDVAEFLQISSSSSSLFVHV